MIDRLTGCTDWSRTLAPCEPEWLLTPCERGALEACGDWFAAMFMSGEGLPAAVRHARAIEAHLLNVPLPAHGGGAIYPMSRGFWNSPASSEGPSPALDLSAFYVALDISAPAGEAEALRRSASAADEAARSAYAKLAAFCRTYPRGGGWTHSILHYDRLLAEGLAGYRVRLDAAPGGSPGAETLRQALSIVLEAVAQLGVRCAEQVEAHAAPDEAARLRRERLATALRSVGEGPPEGFADALAVTAFLFAVDGCDDLGRFDQFMRPFYECDQALGRITRDEARSMVADLWRLVDNTNGWNVALGGSTRDGREASSDFTRICLEAARGSRRPNLALRLRRDSPDETWEAALDLIVSGGGLPALYGEENYLAALRSAHLNLPEDDLRDLAFGGCTETMIHGRSCVGSLDADINVLKTLEGSLRARLEGCPDFEALLTGFEEDARQAIRSITDAVNRNHAVRAEYHPQLLRTLFIDDCLDRLRGYYDGGARWNWSVINVVGLSNAIDSLSSVRRTVFEERSVGAAELLEALATDFEGRGDLRARLARAPKFGNDDPEVNALAARLSGLIYREFQCYAPWRGGRFLCGTLMFVTYGWFGKPVGATPDGRLAGDPVADSAGPVQGRDRRGPTAALSSAAALDQGAAPGTLVVNLRLAADCFRTPEGRRQVRGLVEGYFAQGGLQLQINVVDQALLRDACEHPERYGDLVVRMGGYSEYWSRLDDELRRTLLQRTEHETG